MMVKIGIMMFIVPDRYGLPCKHWILHSKPQPNQPFHLSQHAASCFGAWETPHHENSSPHEEVLARKATLSEGGPDSLLASKTLDTIGVAVWGGGGEWTQKESAEKAEETCRLRHVSTPDGSKRTFFTSCRSEWSRVASPSRGLSPPWPCRHGTPPLSGHVQSLF